MIAVYFHANLPEDPRRSRRYVPLQLEYYQELLTAPLTERFMRGGIVAWEYARAHMPMWSRLGLSHTTHVRGAAPRWCPCACVRVLVRACVCLCVRACACACACVHACVCAVQLCAVVCGRTRTRVCLGSLGALMTPCGQSLGAFCHPAPACVRLPPPVGAARGLALHAYPCAMHACHTCHTRTCACVCVFGCVV
jgi:hypothetical protein